MSASRTMSRSAWPAPTVSMKRRSNPAASMRSDAAAAARERERPLPRVAIDRMKRPSSSGRSSTRTRSPRSAPPVSVDDGSTARIATRRPSARATSASAPTSVLFPTPGGPVTPITLAALSPAAASCVSASSMSASAPEPPRSTLLIACASSRVLRRPAPRGLGSSDIGAKVCCDLGNGASRAKDCRNPGSFKARAVFFGNDSARNH